LALLIIRAIESDLLAQELNGQQREHNVKASIKNDVSTGETHHNNEFLWSSCMQPAGLALAVAVLKSSIADESIDSSPIHTNSSDLQSDAQNECS
jgi:hypothetical protein